MGGPSPLQFLTLAVAATTIGVAVYIIYTRAQDPPPRRRRPRKSGRPSQRILFYHRHEPHFGFTNFAEYPVEYEGRIYPTSEHLFQAFKFLGHRPDIAERIRNISELPRNAFIEARRYQEYVRADWLEVNVEKMDEVLWLKFNQHSELKAELLATGDAELIENSDKDSFWGIGADGKGRNELGKGLMRLRERLLDE